MLIYYHLVVQLFLDIRLPLYPLTHMLLCIKWSIQLKLWMWIICILVQNNLQLVLLKVPPRVPIIISSMHWTCILVHYQSTCCQPDYLLEYNQFLCFVCHLVLYVKINATSMAISELCIELNIISLWLYWWIACKWWGHV